MMNKLLIGLALSSAAAFAGSCYAVPGNLVSNCGFETGDFSGWTQSGNLGATGVTTADDGFHANSGSYFAFLGPVGSDGYLSQTLATTAGTLYDLTFYLGSDGDEPNNFSVTWGGIPVYSAVNLSSTVPSYTEYSFDVVGTGSSDTLKFGFENDPGYLVLDDVSVTAAPEPSSVVMLLSGLGLFAIKLRRIYS
jgi:hypothetical protein